MAYLLRCGAVFLHVPKTGGAWVTQILWELDLIEHQFGHEHADFYRALCPHSYHATVKWVLRNFSRKLVWQRWFSRRALTKLHETWPTAGLHWLPRRRRGAGARRLDTSGYPRMFCFVRHPLSWYESWWRSMCQNDWRHWGDENDVFGWHPNAVLNGLSDDDFHGFIRNVMAKHPGYVTELYGMYAQPQVWFWGKQENLAEDLITVLRRLEVDFDEDRVRDAGPVNISDRRPITWDESLRDQMLRLEHAALVRYGYPTA